MTLTPKTGWFGRRAGAVFLSILALTVLAGATDLEIQRSTIKWKNVGPWEIGVDQQLNYGCFLFAAYEDGTDLKFGFSSNMSHAYIMITDRDWLSLKEGESYSLVFQFDRKPRWSGDAAGVRVRNTVALVLAVPTLAEDFFVDFALSKRLHITHKGKSVASLNLKGSYAATDELLNCQKNMQVMKSERSQYSADPFSQ
ncbi:MAG: hypothetical protein MPJ78_19015 [Hyphomicrobiaceae bacterium]|nr:hypothetical protein [Hyphomicrobiaceae bacterium]